MPSQSLLRAAATYRAAAIREFRAFEEYMASDVPDHTDIDRALDARMAATRILNSLGAVGVVDALSNEMGSRNMGCDCQGHTRWRGWRRDVMCGHKREHLDATSAALRAAIREARGATRG